MVSLHSSNRLVYALETQCNVSISSAGRAGTAMGYGLDGRDPILGRSKIYFSSP
jgi:hypothetical protein